jgi:hypothetical protein
LRDFSRALRMRLSAYGDDRSRDTATLQLSRRGNMFEQQALMPRGTAIAAVSLHRLMQVCTERPSGDGARITPIKGKPIRKVGAQNYRSNGSWAYDSGVAGIATNICSPRATVATS